MKKGRFTEHQIVSALKKHDAGLSIKDLGRNLEWAMPPSTIGNKRTVGSPFLVQIKSII